MPSTGLSVVNNEIDEEGQSRVKNSLSQLDLEDYNPLNFENGHHLYLKNVLTDKLTASVFSRHKDESPVEKKKISNRLRNLAIESQSKTTVRIYCVSLLSSVLILRVNRKIRIKERK